MKARHKQLEKAQSFLVKNPQKGRKTKILFVQGDRLVGKSKFINDLRAILNSETKNQCFLMKKPIFKIDSGLFEFLFQSILERLDNYQSSIEINFFIKSLMEFGALKSYFNFIAFHRKRIRKRIRSAIINNDYNQFNIYNHEKFFFLEYLLSHLYPDKNITFFIDNTEKRDLIFLKRALREYNCYYWNEISINIVFTIPISKKSCLFVNQVIEEMNQIECHHIWLNPLYLIKNGSHSLKKSLSFSPIIPGIVHPSELKQDISPETVFQRISAQSYYSLLNAEGLENIERKQKRFICVLSYLSYLKFEDIKNICAATGNNLHESLKLFDEIKALSFCAGSYYFKDAWRAYLSVKLFEEQYYFFLNEFVVGCVHHAKDIIKQVEATYKKNHIYLNPHIDKQYGIVLKRLFRFSKHEKKSSSKGFVVAANNLFFRIRKFGPNSSPFFIEGVYRLFAVTQNLQIIDFVLDCIELNNFERALDNIEIIIDSMEHAVKWNDLTLALRLINITNTDELFFGRNQKIYIGRLKIFCLFFDFEHVEREIIILVKNQLLSKRFDAFIAEMISFVERINDGGLINYFGLVNSIYFNIRIEDYLNPKPQPVILKGVFKMVKNVIEGNTIINSEVIQQGQGGQIVKNEANKDLISAITAILGEIKSDINILKLSDEAQKEIDAEIKTVEAQLKSSKPKPIILKESLKTIRNVAEGAVGGFLSNGVWEKLPFIIAAIDQMM